MTVISSAISFMVATTGTHARPVMHFTSKSQWPWHRPSHFLVLHFPESWGFIGSKQLNKKQGACFESPQQWCKVTYHGKIKTWELLTANNTTWALRASFAKAKSEIHLWFQATRLQHWCAICAKAPTLLCVLPSVTQARPLLPRLISEPLRQKERGNYCGVNKSRCVSGAVMCS